MPELLPFAFDLTLFWTVGQMVLEGDNPYDTALYSKYYSEVVAGGHGTFALAPFSYPFVGLWFFALLGSLPLEVAIYTWTLLSIIAVLLMAFATLRSVVPAATFVHRFPFLLVALLFPPVVRCILWGQFGAVLAFAIFASFWLSKRGKPLASGLVLSLLFVKPHPFLPFLVAIFFSSERPWVSRAGLGLLIGGALQVIVSLLIAPNAFFQQLAVFSVESEGYANTLSAALLPTVLYLFGAPMNLSIACWLGAAVITAIIAVRRSLLLEEIYFLFLPVSLLVAPFLYSHTLVILLVPFLVLIGIELKDRRNLIWGILLIVSAVSFIDAWSNLIQPAMALLPVAVLLFHQRISQIIRQSV